MASAGIAWAIVRFNAQFVRALPVVICCAIGGTLAGVTAAQVKRRLNGLRQEALRDEREVHAHV